MRIEQSEGTRGSLKWIQRVIDKTPSLLDQRLRRKGGGGIMLLSLRPLSPLVLQMSSIHYMAYLSLNLFNCELVFIYETEL